MVRPFRKARRLTRAVVNIDQTMAQVEGAAQSVERAVVELQGTIFGLGQAIDTLNTTMRHIDETLAQVDVTVSRIGDIAEQYGAVISVASPTMAIDKVRRLWSRSEDDPTDETADEPEQLPRPSPSLGSDS